MKKSILKVDHKNNYYLIYEPNRLKYAKVCDTLKQLCVVFCSPFAYKKRRNSNKILNKYSN